MQTRIEVIDLESQLVVGVRKKGYYKELDDENDDQ